MNLHEIPMPSLGADMDFGTIVNWKIKPGDLVEKGQMIAEVETPKSNIEIESYHKGTIQELLVKEGDKVPVGKAIALYKDQDRTFVPEAKSTKLSPRAKKLLQEQKKQSGVSLKDERQKIIAKLMEKSKQTIPHYYVEKEIELDHMLDWIEKENLKLSMSQKYIPVILFIKAITLALKKYPIFNGHYIDHQFKSSTSINIGIIITLRIGGLLAPTLRNIEQLSLFDLMTEFKALVGRAKELKLKREELTDATICVSNLGDDGADSVIGVIYPPQVALVGIGKIRNKCKIINGLFQEIPVTTWTISGDHRVSNGHEAGLFLKEIERLLHSPQLLEK